MSEQDDTKARLLEAAGEEFAEKGFQGATIRSIIQKAGANIAAVNYHFGDKEQLYVQAVVAAHRHCMRSDGALDATDVEPAAALRAEVRHFLESVFAVDRSDDWHYTLIMREMIRPSRASEALVREGIRPRFERLSATIHQLRPDLEGRGLHAAVFSVVGQCLYYRVGRAFAQRLVGTEAFADLDVEFLTEHITTFTLRGLQAEATHPGRNGKGSRCPGSP